MVAGTLAALAVPAGGCDTVARLTFSDRSYEDLRVTGLSAAEGTCQGSNGAAVMRFVLLDGDGLPINEQSVLNNRDVELSTGDVELEGITYFDTPNVVCPDSNDAALACQGASEGDMCAVRGNAGECKRSPDSLKCDVCSEGFSCDEAPDGLGQLCQTTSGTIAPDGAPQIVSSATQPNQVFALLIEDSASMGGDLPAPIQTLAPDYEGAPEGGPDGIADDPPPGAYRGQNPERESDKTNVRVTAASQIASTWEEIARNASDNNQVETFFGLWTIKGSAATLSSAVGEENFWVNSPSQVQSAVGRLNLRSDSVAAIYESAIAVIEDENGLASDQFGAEDEKVMVLVVDGPDDLRLDTDNSSAQGLIEAANQHNVRIFIVHIDPAVTVALEGSGVPLIPDLPEYVQQQEAECSSDDACKNFEACRRVTAFAQNSGGDVAQPAGKFDGTWCAIERDENGRVGPIDEYAQIACATGGSYMYYPEAALLDAKIEWLPAVLDGLWEVSLNVDAFNRGTFPAGEPYLIEGSVRVTAGERTRSFQMSQDGLFGDQRGVIFSAPE